MHGNGDHDISAPAAYQLTSLGKDDKYTVLRIVGHKSSELAGFKKPENAVLYLALEMKNPQLTRPEAIRNLTSCDGPEWEVPQAVADCVGEDNFACGPTKDKGRNVGLAKCEGKWFVYYYREKYNLYHVGFYPTYGEALQVMADMAWSLRCAEEYARELNVGEGRGIQQAIDMFLTGHSQRSPYDPDNRIKIEVPTYGFHASSANLEDGRDTNGRSDEMHFSDETEEGLFITEPGDRYRPDRRLLHTSAMMSVGVAVIYIVAAVAFITLLPPSEISGCLILLLQGALILAYALAMLKCVKKLTVANYRLLRSLSWILLGSVIVYVVAGIILGMTIHLDINVEPIVGLAFPLVFWDWGPAIITGKYKEWNMAMML